MPLQFNAPHRATVHKFALIRATRRDVAYRGSRLFLDSLLFKALFPTPVSSVAKK